MKTMDLNTLAMSKRCAQIETPMPENVWLNLSQLNLTLGALVSKEVFSTRCQFSFRTKTFR